MAQQVRGKTAIVTGAGSGINLAFARLLLSNGCNVLVADLQLRPEAQELIKSYGGGLGEEPKLQPRAAFVRTDVASWSDLLRALSHAKKLFGQVDIVCPGAGVFEPPWSSFWKPPGTHSSVADSTVGSQYRSLAINLIHPIRLTQLTLLDHLAQMKQGSAKPKTTVIHVSSISGYATPLWCPLYTASKHGINGFVRTLAPLEQGLGFRVVAVAPGLVKTPLWTENPEKAVPIGAETMWVTPEEVAQVMLELVERDYTNDYISGRSIPTKVERIKIDGGTILEVSGAQVREVKQYNDPGPQGIGEKDFDKTAMEEQVLRALQTDFIQPRL